MTAMGPRVAYGMPPSANRVFWEVQGVIERVHGANSGHVNAWRCFYNSFLHPRGDRDSMGVEDVRVALMGTGIPIHSAFAALIQ